jgi:phosphate transport system substrate-binding protein
MDWIRNPSLRSLHPRILQAFVSSALLCGALLIPGIAVSDNKVMNAGGSSFIYPLMTKWSSEYQKKTGKLLNYQSIGSGAGIQQMLGGTFDFGCTDAPMNAEQLAKASKEKGEVVHVPLIMGAVVPVYRIDELTTPLRFSGPVLAAIFMGRIQRWNDPEIAAINAGVTLPDLPIAVVRRADGSGTTYLFTEYLSKVSPEWRDTVGMGTVVDWPRGIGQRGNEGVAGQVARTNGGIGYTELIYALQNKLSYGAVQNQAGEFIVATLDTVTAAAESALKQLPKDLRYSLTNAPGKNAYPIAGTTWAVIYTNVAKERDGAIVAFLRWATTDGQATAATLSYAKLPKAIQDRVAEILNEIYPKAKS